MKRLRQCAAMLKNETGISYENGYFSTSPKKYYNRHSIKTTLRYYRIAGLVVATFCADSPVGESSRKRDLGTAVQPITTKPKPLQ
jgi:hypothetical protein